MKKLLRLKKSGLRLLPFLFRAEEKSTTSMQKVRITVRRANRSDIGFIGELSEKAFKVYGPYGDLVPGWFKSGSTITLVALSNGRRAGFVMIGRLSYESEDRNRCEILAIAVEKEQRRQGIGRMLLREIEKEAERLNESILFLHTATTNISAQQLFRKSGFTAQSVKKKFYPSGQDAVMMMKVL